MEIKLLSDEYINGDNIYQDFINNTIGSCDEHFSGESIWIDHAPDFPIYMNVQAKDRKALYLKAFNSMSDFYLKTPRDTHFDAIFWYSLLLTHKREFLLNNYPETKMSEKSFRNIVLKKFDWENYIYKSVLAAQYISDNVDTDEERERYYSLIVNNLDLYNYIIKYEIFRNEKFLITVLDIVDENNLSEILKAKVKGREDLGEDERVGRRIIFELNKSYPVILAPTLSKEELEIHFMKHLETYVTSNNDYNSSPSSEQSSKYEQKSRNKEKSGILGFFKSK
jgi:hypothetical protein